MSHTSRASLPEPRPTQRRSALADPLDCPEIQRSGGPRSPRADKVADTTPQDHPDRAALLNNLGNCLGTRFERTGSMDDLNRAVDVADKAVDATPQDHPDRAALLTNLGNRLGSRFERTGSIGDLNRAVDVADKAVDATPHDHPDRAGLLNNLGNTLGRRFERTGSMGDLNRGLSSYKEGWNCRGNSHREARPVEEALSAGDLFRMCGRFVRASCKDST
ncbi:hypothetical protein N658DRAFT_269779 [Parathielavia hyrcaniae]|uniref:Tetratricopeptide repeat protein n=1 Tax=Parathielavia hyrcaniae TaxID=113614 RepID=A0AAN6PTS8_9PEZI|nr:hypothetical protein N658DRAFT_269779 [Parathielavia hyrcaniae]